MLDGRGHANCQLVQPSGDTLYRAWMLFISFQAHAKWKPVPEIWCWQANTFRWSSVCNIICIKLQKLRVVWLLNRYLTIWYCSPLLIYLPDNTAPSGSTPLRVKSVAMAIATNVLVLALVVIFVWPSMCIWEFTLLSQDPFWNVEASLTVSTTLTSHLSSCLMSRTIMEVEGEGTGRRGTGRGWRKGRRSLYAALILLIWSCQWQIGRYRTPTRNHKDTHCYTGKWRRLLKFILIVCGCGTSGCTGLLWLTRDKLISATTVSSIFQVLWNDSTL